jgi:hypothetical protein
MFRLRYLFLTQKRKRIARRFAKYRFENRLNEQVVIIYPLR